MNRLVAGGQSRYEAHAVDVYRIGNYDIVDELGRDATGLVYGARHIVLPRRAIIKVMETSDARRLAVQLLREACILEALEHPGIVRVFESGLLPDRRPWFAQERIDGATVADLFAGGPLVASHAVVLVRDIAAVLEHAHRRGVIRCTLRPDRIVITGRSRGYPLCLTDWSDARTHDAESTLPEPAQPIYAAPELAQRATIDDRADVFSLGVIAYQALTGLPPFTSATIAMGTEATAQLVPTEVRCPEAPPELTSLVDQMLAWDRWDRPSSGEVHAELVQIALDMLPPPPPRPPAILRIRKPRWTPALPMSQGEDTGEQLEGLEDDTSVDRS